MLQSIYTHAGCDYGCLYTYSPRHCFNPHTHAGCDLFVHLQCVQNIIVGDRSIIRGYAMRNTTGGKKTASPHCGHFRYVAPWAPLQSVSSRSLQYGQSRAMVIWVEYCCSSSRCSAWMQAYRCGSSALELIFAIITTTSYAVSKSSA